MNLFRILILLLAFCNGSVLADTLQGKVVAISDGDTVTVLDSSNTQRKIRLMGIDAPEKKQAFGNRSKESLSDLLFGKQVAVEYFKQDRYGRIVGKIMVDGTDANLEQVRAGLAWHYKQYEKEQTIDDRVAYAHAEEQAKAARKGLWLDLDPIPPWDWRRLSKQKH